MNIESNAKRLLEILDQIPEILKTINTNQFKHDDENGKWLNKSIEKVKEVATQFRNALTKKSYNNLEGAMVDFLDPVNFMEKRLWNEKLRSLIGEMRRINFDLKGDIELHKYKQVCKRRDCFEHVFVLKNSMETDVKNLGDTFDKAIFGFFEDLPTQESTKTFLAIYRENIPTMNELGQKYPDKIGKALLEINKIICEANPTEEDLPLSIALPSEAKPVALEQEQKPASPMETPNVEVKNSELPVNLEYKVKTVVKAPMADKPKQESKVLVAEQQAPADVNQVKVDPQRLNRADNFFLSLERLKEIIGDDTKPRLRGLSFANFHMELMAPIITSMIKMALLKSFTRPI